MISSKMQLDWSNSETPMSHGGYFVQGLDSQPFERVSNSFDLHRTMWFDLQISNPSFSEYLEVPQNSAYPRTGYG